MRLHLREDAPGLVRVRRSGYSPARRRLGVVAFLTGLLTLGWVAPAAAAGKGWWCHIPMVCEAKETIDFLSSPTDYILQQLADANIWFLGKLLGLLEASSRIDLTSPGFLRQYALIFAASSVMTVALWLVAVAKRAVRGVPVISAAGEAVGLLALQFVVTALTPGTIALLITAVDEVTKVFAPGGTRNFKPFLTSMIKLLSSRPEAGAFVLIVVNLVMLLGALMMWIELLVRSAALYVAVALAPLVNAGLVDRDLWGKTKRWVALVIALALSKPVLVALLGLGSAIMSNTAGKKGAGADSVSQILSGALILFLAVFASAVLYRWIPVFGDDMAGLYQARRSATAAGPMASVDGPSTHMNRAMGHHVQDSLVGGQSKASGSRGAAGTGTGARAGASAGTGGAAAAAGPAGAVVAAAKGGADLTKRKAAATPGTDGADNSPPSGGPPPANGSRSAPSSGGAPPPPPRSASRPPTPGPQPPNSRRDTSS
ncbi:hypothetical protein E0L36_23160 [Streptomyces sp. AJS327]|uniref:hypothetical protein n=1 Tax=Streptomyces sp. AJS327 TaxID=2545265 RepID=UPI0015DEEB2E|nr:hypothetical protein [Streptomyces sp. AJS327]MBA0053659.1 hypothetical protein [Streptomyces sp. AJS327]